MLKKSALTAAILAAFVAIAGAHSGETTEDVNHFQKPFPELMLEAPPATCGANAIEARSEAAFERLLEQQTSSQLEESEATSTYAWSWGSRSRQCIMCSAWVCYPVAC